jgi:hypothetical protein
MIGSMLHMGLKEFEAFCTGLEISLKDVRNATLLLAGEKRGSTAAAQTGHFDEAVDRADLVGCEEGMRRRPLAFS